LETDLPPHLPQVRGDREKLQQVLINLVENALKFTPPAGRITLSAQAQNGMVEVRVTDTGAGIPQEHLPYIFERFYKVDRARRDGGTGLGLAIVKQIVEAHRGETRVESQEGAGSAFAFTVPRA
jgi:signal transduction histidine kinase